MSEIIFTIAGKPEALHTDSQKSWMQALEDNGIFLDAPCGGHGSCGKCRILVNGKEVLACQTQAAQGAVLTLPARHTAKILSAGQSETLETDGQTAYALAIDLGTTTIVCCLRDGVSGALLAQKSCLNPQTQYGADVISRIECAQAHGAQALSACVWEAFETLTEQCTKDAGIVASQIGMVCIVGNTAMHHLLLGFDTKPLITPPYMPASCIAIERRGIPELPCCAGAILRVLPNIAGFVGADTVGCLCAARFDQISELTLLIDIGTNGEMVLGSQARRAACSTAVGPAFEGAKITCGMRGASGAVDHVRQENGTVLFHTVDDAPAIGLCGSGRLDLVAVLLELNIIDESGKLTCGERYTLPGTDVFLTQKDIREVQLAKAAIRAGIELLCSHLGVRTGDIQQVLLAGAFGNYLAPVSACRIGMIPVQLLGRIRGIGNAAGDGAQRCALSRAEFERSKRLAAETEFLELASKPDFQDRFVDALSFEEEDDDDTD